MLTQDSQPETTTTTTGSATAATNTNSFAADAASSFRQAGDLPHDNQVMDHQDKSESSTQKPSMLSKKRTSQAAHKSFYGEGPATRFSLETRKFTVTVKKGGKNLVNDVSVSVDAGHFTCLLGPSGCGKTTLLENLANFRKSSLKCKGEVLFNGKKLTSSERRNVSSFCSKENSLLGEFTVRETLFCAARLYFGYRVDIDVIDQKINGILKSTGLEDCKDTVVGNVFYRGLSGGQKRRLSIAVELMLSPAVLFLDEPTSGLDSTSSLGILRTIESLAKQGHTIFCSLQQPSSKMWTMMEDVVFMSLGRCVYFGPAKNLFSYLELVNMRCPENMTIADYFITRINTDFDERDLAEQGTSDMAIQDAAAGESTPVSPSKLKGEEFIVSLANTYETSSFRKAIQKQVSERKRSGSHDDSNHDDDDEAAMGTTCCAGSAKSVGFFPNMVTLLHRSTLSLWKNPGLLGIRVGLGIFMGLQIGLIFLFVGNSKSPSSIFGTVAVLMGGLSMLAFLGVTAIPFVMEERATFSRERQNGMYQTSSYLLAKVILFIPTGFILAILSCVMIFYMAALNDFWLIFVSVWVLLFISDAFNFAFACILNDYASALAISILANSIFFFTGGFFIPFFEMSWAIRWLAYVNPMRYYFFAINIAQWGSQGAFNYTGGPTPFQNGQDVLNFYGVNDTPVTASFGGNIGLMFAIGFFFIILSYVSLEMRSRA